jgi:predicted  nucleic acid-binding Zn-ribbon protein
MRKNMSNQSGLSLSKALKLKNRLAGRLAKTNLTIAQYNCTVDGRKDEVNIKELDTQRTALVAALVDLKTSIYEANKGIYRNIILIGEKKGEIEFLSGLNTKHGTEPHGYQSQQVTYVSVIQKTDVDKRVKQLEKEIDALQDKIDEYNAQPERIRVSESILDLAS